MDRDIAEHGAQRLKDRRKTHPTSVLSRSLFPEISLRSCCSMRRTAGIANWKASSQDSNVFGSGASAAIVKYAKEGGGPNGW